MEVFDRYAERYDEWYDKNKEIYKRELQIIQSPDGLSLEIGVGTGRFALPLNVSIGIDRSQGVLKIAKKRGIEVLRADASMLPFKNSLFGTVYVIFTLCFLEKPLRALREARRVLKDSGKLVICIVPRNSELGKKYAKKDSPFYRIARFYTEKEVEEMLEEAGFAIEVVRKRKLLFSSNDFVCFYSRKKKNSLR